MPIFNAQIPTKYHPRVYRIEALGTHAEKVSITYSIKRAVTSFITSIRVKKFSSKGQYQMR